MMGGEFGGEWIHVCVWLSPFAVHLKLSQHCLLIGYTSIWASQVVLVVKNPPANAGDAGDVGDTGSIPGSGRSPGGGHGNPLQYSCLENPVDRGALQATVDRVTKSQTQLSD